MPLALLILFTFIADAVYADTVYIYSDKIHHMKVRASVLVRMLTHEHIAHAHGGTGQGAELLDAYFDNMKVLET